MFWFMIVKGNWWESPVIAKKVLILGGTGEAANLAKKLFAETSENVEIITSFAGRTKNPPALPGRVISGGFGGIDGLKRFIVDEAINIVVNATHPFAATISENAYVACMVTNTLSITLVRPKWTLPPSARWVEVDDMDAASAAIDTFAKRPFLTIGSGGLGAFAHLHDMWFLVRVIEQSEAPLPFTNYQIVTGRPPYDIADERQLISEHQIDCLVTKHSGGSATEGKILAALEANIPIILIRRPLRLPGHWTDTVEECADWVQKQL